MSMCKLLFAAVLLVGCGGNPLVIDGEPDGQLDGGAVDLMPPWACRTDAGCGGEGQQCRNADAGVSHCEPGLYCSVYMAATQQHREVCVRLP